MKLAIPGTPSIAEYICGNLNAGDTVGLDGMLFTEEYKTSRSGETLTPEE